MSKTLQLDRLLLGACYYPEQWPEDMWDDDYRRMKELGFSVVRMAEFAWSVFEPEEGRFAYGLFDRALDTAGRHGLQVILGTPTATPPAWLTHKYPEVLNARQDGMPYRHGQRRHYNYNSPVYRELSARIVRKMTERYAGHPSVAGWQIDNELNCETSVFYSEADHEAFRAWCRNKYGTLEKLNAAWGAVFWNQTYTDWEQVFLTRPTVSDSPNPHHALDEKRFFSDSAIGFARMQSDILRELAAPHQFITTNGVFGHLDNHRLTEDTLDFFSYDSYPNFHTIYPDGGDEPLLDRKWSLSLSYMRGISPNFCVMEQQSGSGGWTNLMKMPSPKPGQMRLWTYQSLAHGADMIVYFRWRTAVFGTEIYWHGIHDYDNRPNRRVAEAGWIGAEFARIGSRIAGTRNEAEVAVIRSYDNDWDGELDAWHGSIGKESVYAWQKALQYRHIPADSLYLGHVSLEQLQAYKAVIAPHLSVLSEEDAQLLQAYAEGGGTVVFGCRTGYKDPRGHCRMEPSPGPAAEMCGVEAEDFTLIGPFQASPSIRWAKGQSHISGGCSEILRVVGDSAQVLAAYGEDAGYYAGKPALVQNAVGTGTVLYYGGGFTTDAVYAVIGHLGWESPAAGKIGLHKKMELTIRTDGETGNRYAFVLNYSHDTERLMLHGRCRELLSEEEQSDEQWIEPFGVRIYLL